MYIFLAILRVQNHSKIFQSVRDMLKNFNCSQKLIMITLGVRLTWRNCIHVHLTYTSAATLNSDHCAGITLHALVLFHPNILYILSQKGFTPLHEAARQGHVRIVEILLKWYDSPDPEGKVSQLCL